MREVQASEVLSGARALGTREIVEFLKRCSLSEMTFLEKAKFVYRPYICPYDDLLLKVPRNAKVADIGCGTGSFLLLVAEYCSPKSLGGLETNPSLLRFGKSLLRSYQGIGLMRFEHYDGRIIPEWLEDFDCVCLIDVLHHVRRREQPNFLKSIFNTIRPGARLIIKDINAGRKVGCLFNKIHDLVIARECTYELSLDELREMLSQIGLKVIDVAEKHIFVYPHFTITAIKP